MVRKTRKDSSSSATSSSTSSLSKNKSLKKTSCSKFIEKILNELISKQNKVIQKHSTTVHKWLNKMKLSILKKISLSSRILFQSPETDINELKRQIKEKTHDILIEKQNLINSAKQLWQQNLPKLPNYENNRSEGGVPPSSQSEGLFDDAVNQINEKIDFMGNRISSLSSDLDNRLHAMEGLIEVVQNGRKLTSSNNNNNNSSSSGSTNTNTGIRQTRSMKQQKESTTTTAPTSPVQTEPFSSTTTSVTRKRALPIQMLNKTLREG